MARRISRGITARTLTAPSEKVLGIWEIYPNETLLKISGSLAAMTRDSNDIERFYEADLLMLYIPYSVFMTYLDDDDDLDTLPTYPTTVASIDQRLEQLWLDADESSSQYYGGADPDVSKVGPDPDDTTKEPIREALVESDDPKAGVRFRGPTGIVRLASEELLIPAWGADGIGVGRHAFSMRISKNVNISNPGFVVLGVKRSKVYDGSGDATEDTAHKRWNILGTTAASARNSALNRLRGGDMDRIRQGLLIGGEDWCDEAVGILYGSEQFIEGTNVVLSNNTFNVAVKYAATYDTPYSVYS